MPEMHADHADQTDERREGAEPDAPIRYPANQVLAALDSEEQVTDAVRALTSSGFLESEVHVLCGAAAADRLGESTGRGGLAGLAIRIAERLGIADEEMEGKAQYEQALRDGRFVLGVAAPTEERKDRASEVLHAHGANMVRFHGRFAIEGLRPPDTV